MFSQIIASIKILSLFQNMMKVYEAGPSTSRSEGQGKEKVNKRKNLEEDQTTALNTSVLAKNNQEMLITNVKKLYLKRCVKNWLFFILDSKYYIRSE